jgi:hypothetical protein
MSPQAFSEVSGIFTEGILGGLVIYFVFRGCLTNTDNIKRAQQL